MAWYQVVSIILANIKTCTIYSTEAFATGHTLCMLLAPNNGNSQTTNHTNDDNSNINNATNDDNDNNDTYYTFTCIYIYIYIQRERCIHPLLYTCIHIYIYIYIYMHTHVLTYVFV